jgi:hypothetical protein
VFLILQAKLLKAIDDFAKRIVPLFEELEMGRTRIQELEDEQQGSVSSLTAKSRQLEIMQKEIVDLRGSNDVLQRQFSEALESAELFQMKTEESQQRLVEARQSLAMREEERRQAIDSLKRFKISVSRKNHYFVIEFLWLIVLSAH